MFDAEEPTEVTDLWRDDLVAFVIGCSFSFEAALLAAAIPVRHVEQGTNVPMYRTNKQSRPAGPFRGEMVVSMRPIPAHLVAAACTVTARYPKLHGAPVHVGDPKALGIQNLDQPDFGDASVVKDGEVPVFWACGVTPQLALENARPDIAITHAPGHMLVLDTSDDVQGGGS